MGISKIGTLFGDSGREGGRIMKPCLAEDDLETARWGGASFPLMGK